MPELPEVETARRNLTRWMEGHRVVRTETSGGRTFRDADVEAFLRLRGRLRSADRRGKVLLLTFEREQGLLCRLGMTGKWVRRTTDASVPHSHARLILGGGVSPHFVDPRTFGRLMPMPASALWDAVASLGVDPLTDPLDGPSLARALENSRQELKVALMDQERIAGLGNIHAAEALFRAGLHPRLRPAQLRSRDWKRLAEAIRETIVFGLAEQEGEEQRYLEEGEIPNPFLVYGRAGTPCTRCGTRVEGYAQGGRTTHACPHCQRLRDLSR